MAWTRWVLILQTRIIRSVGNILSFVLQLSRQQHSPATFRRTIPTNISPGGEITLYFYTPKDYLNSGKQRSFATVVNFHGGGFCLGKATDDSAWCNIVVRDLDAIVVSVAYRLAPEYPYPIAVQDGVDALRYLTANAFELCIDVDRIATSGFSAGGNLSITVPLMFHQLQENQKIQVEEKATTIKAVVAWYPSTDFTRSREQRVATMKRPDKQLPPFLTRMFDDGYIPGGSVRASPYLSPFVAADHFLPWIPRSLILYTCEWDMLEKEGTDLARRLRDDDGNNVRARMIKGVPHGWDKFPGASPPPEPIYSEACLLLRKAFEGEDISTC